MSTLQDPPASTPEAARHRPLAELEAGAAHLLAAPTDAGPIDLLVRRPGGSGTREVVAAARLDPVVGMLGDTWIDRPSKHTADGSPHPGMQLTIMGTRVIDLLTGGDRSAWPLAGDQVYADLDLSEDALPAGTRLAVGTAVVEISAMPHTGCAKFDARFGRDALRFISTPRGRRARWRGVNAIVLIAGEVSTGDEVRRLRT